MKFRSFINTKDKMLLILSILLFTLATVIGLMNIILAFKIFTVIADQNTTLLPKYWIVIILLTVVGIVLESLADLVKHNLGYNVVKKIRISIALRLKQFSLSFYTNERLGEISNIVNKDVDNMEMIVAHLWSRMFASIVSSIIIGTGLFMYNYRMGLALISLLPIALIVLLTGTRKNSKNNKDNQDNLNTMLCLFLEYVKGISVIKSFKYKVFKNKIDDSVDNFSKSSIKASNSVANVVLGYILSLEMCSAVLTGFGAYFVIGDSLSIMGYIIFIVLGNEFYKPFYAADGYWVQYISVKESLQRISKITETPVVKDRGNRIVPEEKSVTFKNVGFCYNSDSFSIENINFKVEAGTLTALVGPSGSGKTTITNLILRFYDSYTGSILIGNTEIRDIPYNDLLSNISIVMQNVVLFSGTIYENILMGNRHATEAMVIEAARAAMIHDDILSFPNGYQTELGESGKGISGGQKQRLSIARAFLKNSPIIILDEATSNIDPINERKIQQAISHLIKNRTIIVVAHQLRTIQNADQIIVFNQGKIIEKGTHDLLIDNEYTYQKLWNAQQ